MYSRIALFFVSLLWGLSFVFTKDYLEVMNPLVFTGYSFLLSGIFFVAVAAYQKKKLSFRLREGILLGVLLFLMEGPQMIGLSETTAANTAFITSVGILLIPILEWLIYKRDLKRATIFALVVALVGIHLLTGGVNNFNVGDVWIVLAAFGALFYMVYLDHFEKEKNSTMMVLCAQQFLTVGVVSLVIAYVSNAPFGYISGEGSLVPFFWLTLIFTLVPYLLLQWAERSADEVQVTFYSVLEPVVGGLAAWTIGPELATPGMMLGGGLIVFALLVTEFANRHHTLRHLRRAPHHTA
jgi:drug/metabolite transporter (DMT)-like permease